MTTKFRSYYKKETRDALDRVEEILRKHDIKLYVGGCGCCGSPWFKMEYKGEEIIDIDDVGIDMFEEE